MKDNINVEVIKAGKTGLFCNYIFKAIPLAFDESLSYYECLCGLLNYLKNTIIPTVNNNADAVIELQQLFEKLQTFVNNYFDNLDVQEEINNKLDEMVINGTLQNILMNYANVEKIYNTHQEMIEDTGLINYMKVKTLGYYTINDGGGATYYITNTPDNTKYQEYVNNLYITLIENTEINVHQFGAKGDGITDDTISIQNAIDNVNKYNKALYFNNNTYLISHITISNRKTIINGNKATLKSINNNSNQSLIELNNDGVIYTNLNNLFIDGNNENIDGILITRNNFVDTQSNINNINISNCKYGLNITGDYSYSTIRELKINNVVCRSCKIGLFANSMTDSYILNSTFADNTDYGIYLDTTGSIKISNCKCYFNGKNINTNLSLERIPASAFNITSDENPIIGKNYYTREGTGSYQNPYIFTLFTGNTFASETDYYEITGDYKNHGNGIYLKNCTGTSLNTVEIQDNAGDGIYCNGGTLFNFINISCDGNGLIWDNDFNIIKYQDTNLQQYFYGIYFNNCLYINLIGYFNNFRYNESGIIQRSSLYLKNSNNNIINITARLQLIPIEIDKTVNYKSNMININGYPYIFELDLSNITLENGYNILNNNWNGSSLKVINNILYFTIVFTKTNIDTNSTKIGVINTNLRPNLMERFNCVASLNYPDDFDGNANISINKNGEIKVKSNLENAKYVSISGSYKL